MILAKKSLNIILKHSLKNDGFVWTGTFRRLGHMAKVTQFAPWRESFAHGDQSSVHGEGNCHLCLFQAVKATPLLPVCTEEITSTLLLG